MVELEQLLMRYKAVRQQRMELEQAAKELKEQQEAPLREQILQYLFENNMQSVHFPSVGRVLRVKKSHYEIVDKEVYARMMLQSLVEAAEEGRPLSDGFIAQFRVGKDTYADFMSRHEGQDTGVLEVINEDLTIRKS